MPEERPAHHVRDLRMQIGEGNRVLEKLFEYELLVVYERGENVFVGGEGGLLWCRDHRSGG